MRGDTVSSQRGTVSLRGIGKQYGGVFAIRGIDLDIRPGEVQALLGENGAGKSTLVNILGGVIQPDEGVITVGGEPVELTSPHQSMARGITIVHQELALFGDLSVAENVFAGNAPRGAFGLDWAGMRRRAADAIGSLGLRIDPDQPLRRLSIGDQQLVEIAKALIVDSRVLVLDEPTASLSAGEVERLIGVIERLKAEGVAILFISHRLDEVERLADSVTTLRDGRIVASLPAAGLTRDDMIRQMVGRQLDALFPKADATIGQVVLTADGLSRTGSFDDVSFVLREGEILGFSGLVGAGRTEVARVIFGIDRADAGSIEFAGEPVRIRDPRDAMRLGIAYVPEDRRDQGLILSWSILRNTTLTLLEALSHFGIIDRTAERRTATAESHRLEVRAASVDQLCSSLSGGNQQKVVLAKWLARSPKVLILDEPTRGVDIGTKAEIHRLVSELATQGLAIILISSELPEIIGMSDRVMVFHEGRVSAVVERADLTEERLMAAAAGEVHRVA